MRAVIYARYSAGPNQTDTSIEGQVKECRRHIDRNGYEYAGLYADRHISGRTDKRPEFQRMMDEARSGGFSVVVVYSLDRFSRDRYDSAIYKKELRDLGVEVESATEAIPGGPEGIFFEGMLEAMAEYYSAELSKKVRRGLDLNAKKARSVGGPTPFGYVLEDGIYKKNEKQAPHVAEIFSRFLAGASFADCARYLNGLGFTTSKGRPFSSGTIKKMLSNKKYAGYYVYNGTEIEGGMPALVSEDVFFKVRLKMKQNRPRAPRGDFALSGKLIHGACGSAMTGTSGTGKSGRAFYYYRCPKKDIKPIPRDRIEEAVASHVRAVLGSEAAIDSLVDKLYAYQLEEWRSDTRAATLEDTIKDLDRKIENCIDQIAENGPSPRVQERLETYEADRAIMRADLDALQKGPMLSRDALRAGMYLALRHDSVSTDRVLKIFVHRVVVYPEKLLIEFNFHTGDALGTTELLRFDQNGEWWSIGELGQTLTIYRGRVLLLAPWQ